MDIANVRNELREFIESNMEAFSNTSVQDGDNIFEKGFVSSIFSVQLLDFIESKYDVVVDDEDITLSNFKSIDCMILLLEKLRGNNNE